MYSVFSTLSIRLLFPGDLSIICTAEVYNLKRQTNTKQKKRNIASLAFAVAAMAMFFPYKQLTWTVSFFGLAFIGAVLAALALYIRNIAQEEKGSRAVRVLTTLGFWFSLISFIAAVGGILATGILACSVYLS